MAMKRSTSSEKTIQKWIKEGRGDGRGENYKPWLTVRDCASRGRSHRVFGHKSQRPHHLLSDLELAVFLLMEWHPDTVEIREQFPLRRDETIILCEDAGIKHPNVSGVRQVMSSDFLVNSNNHSCPQFAIQAKYVESLNDRRTIEKLEIERRYWARKSVPWKVITEQDIPSAVFNNINWLYPAQECDVKQINVIEKIEYYHHYFKKYPTRSIIEVAQLMDKSYELTLGQSLLEIRQLLANRCFLFNILTPCRKLTCHDLTLVKVTKRQQVLNVSNQ